MLPPDFLKVFLCRLTLLYLLLLLPWPGFNAAYGEFFRSLGSAVFSQENECRTLTFEAPQHPARPQDTRVAIVNLALLAPDGSGPVRHLDFNARALAWNPTALLLALTLATPIPLQRRLRALFFGMLYLHGFILLTLGVGIVNESTEIGLMTLSPLAKAAANACKDLLARQIGMVLPVLIWILITFRREDLAGLRALSAGKRQRNQNFLHRMHSILLFRFLSS